MRSINFKENKNVVRNEGLNIYMSEMNARKPLSDSEVRELITKAQNGSQRARNKVIEANLRIVWSIAASYKGRARALPLFHVKHYGETTTHTPPHLCNPTPQGGFLTLFNTGQFCK